MREEELFINNIPTGPLGLIPIAGCEEMGRRVDSYLVKWRKERQKINTASDIFSEYEDSSFMISSRLPRFGSGEGKGEIERSVRGEDIYIIADVCNYSLTYTMNGREKHMSPDDHFQNVKRIIAAVGGRARRVTVIMPYLYESRQTSRNGRESLDCALALQELVSMGVDHIITFDAHDPRVSNAIPLSGFETIRPTYQFIKALLASEDGLKIDSDHMMIISPDEGGMSRAIYYANVMGLDVGMFYKRRDFTRYENGQHPVVAHEFLGSYVAGKDVIIVDDMISSGHTMLETARELKHRNARKVFAFSTFGLFTGGLDMMDECYEKGLIDKVFTTNLIYQPPQLLARPYYVSVDMSKYIATIIDYMNHDVSLSGLLNPTDKINKVLKKYRSEA